MDGLDQINYFDGGDYMFGISYDNWKSVCEMYFNLSVKTQKAYLQWFPFSLLSESDKKKIASFDFYNEYINLGKFTLDNNNLYKTDNYIQKTDGSFRDSTLISPIMFLILQAIGKNISYYYRRENTIVKAYYAGDYSDMYPKYKKSYDEFFKIINVESENYKYFIKTDITNFFNNINVNSLFNRIDAICNKEKQNISQLEISMCKDFLLYCGNGRFPLVENSIASSYLATIVYLDQVDKKFSDVIQKRNTQIKDFIIVRYVDDMYILFNTVSDKKGLQKIYNSLKNEYSSILKEHGLSLNTRKCCFGPIGEINRELKKSLYFDEINFGSYDLSSSFSTSLINFLNNLYHLLTTTYLGVDEYNELIEECFFNPIIDYTPDEVFNHFVYEDNDVLTSEEVVTIVKSIIDYDVSVLSLDSKRLSVLVLKTASSKYKDRAVISLLNNLFERNRNDSWNSYDTIVAVSYLLQSGFRHIDLLKVLGEREPKFYRYYENYISKSFLTVFKNDSFRNICYVQNDWKACYLYLMFSFSFNRKDYILAYSFYKNFFDRVSADITFYFKLDKKRGKKPNYSKYYKEKSLIDLYSKSLNSEHVDTVIKKAHRIRNSSPLSHASSELIDKVTSNEIIECIRDLHSILMKFIEHQLSVFRLN